ncbi:MAG: DUF2726 domain-containing protein [Ruminiclostridium sp.]|nr:DUF2726 domain-containing protein [Ruminiclostridium sp.]
MNPITIIIIIIALVIIFFMALAMNKLNNKSKESTREERKPINEPMPYKLAESIFTKSEKALFDTLEDLCKDKNLILLSKVRMADIAKIENGCNNFQYWFNKIRSKHVDFLVCKRENGKPILAIELDDYTHNQKSRKERDEFVNTVYEKIGLKILHITELNKEKIEKELANLI